VRIKAYREKPATSGSRCRATCCRWSRTEERDVVDTQKSRLYLYENDGGRPRFVADYYISRTASSVPTRCVRVTRRRRSAFTMSPPPVAKKLSDFYGTGAFPINYPNEWDKRQGRNGHGIWLHGTPSDTFRARPRHPKAASCCPMLISMSLAKNLQGRFDAGHHQRFHRMAVARRLAARTRRLNNKIEEWRTDWESRDIDRFLAHYSKKFKPSKQNFAEFAAQKRQVNYGQGMDQGQPFEPAIDVPQPGQGRARGRHL
jgi:hypothetical protein